jgi:hypothetical protein
MKRKDDRNLKPPSEKESNDGDNSMTKKRTRTLKTQKLADFVNT